MALMYLTKLLIIVAVLCLLCASIDTYSHDNSEVNSKIVSMQFEYENLITTTVDVFNAENIALKFREKREPDDDKSNKLSSSTTTTTTTTQNTTPATTTNSNTSSTGPITTRTATTHSETHAETTTTPAETTTTPAETTTTPAETSTTTPTTTTTTAKPTNTTSTPTLTTLTTTPTTLTATTISTTTTPPTTATTTTNTPPTSTTATTTSTTTKPPTTTTTTITTTATTSSTFLPQRTKYPVLNHTIQGGCPLGYEFSEVQVHGNVCIHQCERMYCENIGECIVQIGDNMQSSAVCRCKQENDVVYSGPTCAERHMTPQRERAIILGVLIPVAGLLLLTAVCACYSLKKHRHSFRHTHHEGNL